MKLKIILVSLLISTLLLGTTTTTPTQRGYTPLYGAIEYANIEIVKFLIKNGADINIHSRSDTSLIHAIKYGKIDIAKLLIDANVKLDSVNLYNKTALDIAREKKNESLIKLLDKKQ